MPEAPVEPPPRLSLARHRHVRRAGRGSRSSKRAASCCPRRGRARRISLLTTHTVQLYITPGGFGFEFR